MTSFQRPGPDRDKIAAAWATWRAGDEPLPGRTMADLKIGGADLVLEALADGGADGDAWTAWTQWERGRSGPAEVLATLEALDFAAVVEALPAE